MEDEIPPDIAGKADGIQAGNSSSDSIAVKTLDSALKDVNLNVNYWTIHLKLCCGVTEYGQLAFLDDSCLRKLEKVAKHEWEINALKKLLGIGVKYDKEYKDKRSREIERGKEAQKILTDLKALTKEGRDRNDTMVKNKENELKEALKVTDEVWIRATNDLTIDSIVNKFSGQLGKLEELETDRKELSGKELLERASGGLALKGILVTKSFEDRIETRRTVIEAPKVVELKNPITSQKDDVVEFSSKNQSDNFDRSLEMIGYSMSGSGGGGNSLFQVGAGIAVTRQKNTEQESIRHTDEMYLSRTMYSYVPTSVCEIEKGELRFCEDALHALKQLGSLQVATYDKRVIQEKCESFLKKYGSHVNAGHIEFGGVYQWQATFDGKTDSKKEKIQEVVQLALDTHVSVSFGVPGIKPNMSVSANRTHAKGDVNASYMQSELSRTTLKTEKKGGPQEVSDLPLWKKGLIRFNDTWAIIDRGHRFEDFVGVWEIIRCNGKEFPDAAKLAQNLQETWELMSGMGHTSLTKVEDAVRSMDEFLGEVINWGKDENLAENAVTYLEKMGEQARLCSSLTGDNRLWVSKINENTLTGFLRHIMQIEDQYPSSEFTHVKHLLRNLVNATKEPFRLSTEILHWVSDKPTVERHHPEVNDIQSLVTLVKEKLLPRMKTADCREESTDQRNIEITRDLALAVNHLRTQFTSAEGKQYDLFLLMVTLILLRYDTDKLYFDASLTEQSLTEFIGKLEQHCNELEQYKGAGEQEMQVYLIKLLVLSSSEYKENGEKEFNRLLSPLQNVLCPDILKALAKFTQESPYRWNRFLHILEELRSGSEGSIEPNEIDISPFSEISISAEQWVLTEDFERKKYLVPDDSTDVGKMLRKLGLTEYYPSKLTLQHVTAIGGQSKGTLLSNLPWRILDKLLMCNYNGRDNELGECIFRDDHRGTREDDEINIDDILGNITCSEVDELPNTLDIFQVIYSCCDLMLKQSLVQKMYLCRLAVPLISPQMIGDSLGFSLWALRSINLKWRDSRNNCLESSVESYPMKSVSFIKFGNPSVSKSSLLNMVISRQRHNTFWNKECPNGNSDYSLADGLVETQWYCPSGKPTDTFKDVTMFLNLRGDANHHKKQMTVLKSSSNVIVCLIETKDLENHDVLTTMKTLHNSSKLVLLLAPPDSFDKDRLKRQLNTCLECLVKPKNSNFKFILGFKETQAKTNEDLGQELRDTVRKFLDGEDVQGKTIIDTSILAKDAGIAIDEDDELCKTAKDLANEVRQIIGGKTANECRGEMFPLQGNDWHEWSKLQMSKHRTVGRESQCDLVHELSDLQEKMTLLRQSQLDSCQAMSPITRTLLRNLLKVIDSPVVILYLQWLKFLFNELNSDSSKRDNEKIHPSASLGLEHLFRELTQMFEAGKGSCFKLSASTNNFINQLPKIAAKLLLKGQPMELMDGDAENVPLTWVKAVMSALKDLVGDKTLFALSVLGVQSSGKSTLLNTMFGQQFAVSAGRCTQGVYMQLVEVNNKETDLPYDYLLLMDTEGLRAPELGQQMYGNDNQLATFVVGLGDVAIINIKGENLAEISDVLQITVHAFLRMKMTLKKRNKCIFIHQNVPDINAKEEVSHGCQLVRETLDKMTTESCSIEHVLDVHSFNDVIEFDSEKSVWYYSDLWQGDPPMAPVNPGYTEKVQETKEYLLRDLTQRRDTFLTISNLTIRIEDMWKGVLSENFVFSFRNSLAAKAYTSLESTYHEKCWTIESNIAKWVTQTAFVRLEKCTTPEDLELCTSTLCLEVVKLSNRLRDDAHSDLKQFFETHNLKDILIQWKVEKMQSIDNEATHYAEGAVRDIQAKKGSLKVDVLQKTKEAEHNLEIMNKAKRLAHDMKDNPLNEKQLQEKFDQVWIEWVKEFSERDRIVQPPSIEQCVERTLLKRFTTYGSSLTEELENNPLSRFKGPHQLSHIFIDDTDLSFKEPWYSKWTAKEESKEKLRRDCKYKAEQSINIIMGEVKSYLHDIQQEDRTFNESDASCVINSVHDRLMKHNREHKEGFTLKSDLIVVVAVSACHHAVQTFHLMDQAYKQRHGVATKITKIKRAAWNLFINTVNQSAIEVTAACNLTNHLEDLISHAVRTEVSRLVVKEMLQFFHFQKCHLLTEILQDLADGALEPYKWFLLDSKPFSLVWITSFTNKIIFPVQDNVRSHKASTVPTYVDLAERETDKLCECVRRGIKTVSELVKQGTCPNVETWGEALCDAIAGLPIKKDYIKSLLDQDVQDLEHLEKLLIESLQEIKDSMLHGFNAETPDSIKWEGTTPYKQILDRLWGCTAQCPFCGEVCQETDPDHASKNVVHRCIYHRPIGVTGTRWKQNSKLSLMTCNLNVKANNVFDCEACNQECKESGGCLSKKIVSHQYKEYKTYLPKWDIPPSSDPETSKYWMWFMSTFRFKLAEWWNTKVPDVPNSWKQVTKQEAVDSLTMYTN